MNVFGEVSWALGLPGSIGMVMTRCPAALIVSVTTQSPWRRTSTSDIHSCRITIDAETDHVARPNGTHSAKNGQCVSPSGGRGEYWEGAFHRAKACMRGRSR